MARLLALEARAHASQGDAGRSTALLSQATHNLDVTTTHDLSPWVSRFDEGSLANDAARCFLALGRLRAAQRQAERILTLRPPTRGRSRAFGQLVLANILIAQRRPDEACAVVDEVLAALSSLSSYLVSAQLTETGKRLTPFVDSHIVASCLERLREVAWTREPFHQWLATEEPTS